MEPVDTLVSARWVMPVEPDGRVLEHHSVAIRSGRIEAVLPMMETGATDGLRLRNAGIPVYGVTGIAYDPEDVRAHGKDERISKKNLGQAVRAYARLLEISAG